MKRTFCDANKFRLRIADRTIGRFEFCFSFWVFIRSFLKGGGSSLKEKKPQSNLQDERRTPSMNFRENTCKTLIIIYQISQNKSISYEDKDSTKKD